MDFIWREVAQQYNCKSKNKLNKELISGYAKLIEAGYPFEIIDGDNLFMPAEFLEAAFQKIRPLKRFCIVSIIGPQSSSNSTLLSHLFDCDFNVSDGRCTRGIYGSIIKSNIPEYDYIMIIDSEGL